jgi:hypothetical protein
MQSFSNSFNVVTWELWENLGGFLHFRVLHSIKGVPSVLADFEIIPIEAVKRPVSWGGGSRESFRIAVATGMLPVTSATGVLI